MSRWLLAALMAVGLMSAGGCARATLETGYKVRPLTTNYAARRAFYADPYSPEVRDAAGFRDDFEAMRRRR